MRRVEAQKGFSLVEMMVVIGLLAIVAGIAIPAYQTYLQNSRLKTATRQITSDMFSLKTRAISEKRQYRISFPAIPGTTYTIEQGTAAGAPFNTIQTKNLVADDTAGVTISNSNFTDNQIVFQLIGICSSGDVTLTNVRNSTAFISSSITGRTNVTYTMQ